MKRLILLFSLLLSFFWLTAQESKEEIPFYDYEEMQLTNEATIAESDVKDNKITITGVVYKSDGVTPAENVVLYLYQHDENGEFQFNSTNKGKRLKHRGWIKTDASGVYTFNTFIPGEAIIPLNYPRQYGPKQIYLVAKTDNSSDFNLPAFMFKDDDLLSKSCIKRLKRKGIDCILEPQEKDGALVATKNIILPEDSEVN